MENKFMNLKKLCLLSASLLMFLSFSCAQVKGKKQDNFLKINDNIQNEELRTELEGLKEEFNMERTKIQKYYNEKIEALKETRLSEVKTIKNDFAKRREEIMKKYVGKMQKKTPARTPDPVNNAQGKMKVPKDRKKNREP